MNAIAPGFFMTEQNHALQFNPDGTPTPRCAHIVDGTPMRRYGELKELIGAMLFLVDERAASFVTGIVLPDVYKRQDDLRALPSSPRQKPEVSGLRASL